MKRVSRAGFKLIELVVVIGLLTIFAMIMLPIVLRVRANAARTQTNDNLRQCAVAIHKYHDVNHKFPDAAWTGGDYQNPGEERSMWFHLLPFVEQESVYKNNVHDAVVVAYLAPSDPSTWNVEGKISFAGNIRLFGYATLTALKANSAVTLNNGDPSGLSLRTDLTETMQSQFDAGPDSRRHLERLHARHSLPRLRLADRVHKIFRKSDRYGARRRRSDAKYRRASRAGQGSVLRCRLTSPTRRFDVARRHLPGRSAGATMRGG